MGKPALKGMTALSLLMSIIDPDGNMEQDDVISAVGERFGISYDGDRGTQIIINSRITGEMVEKGWISRYENKWWSIEIAGIVHIEHHYVEMKWITDAGEEHKTRYNEEGILFVNGKEMKRRKWNEKKMYVYRNDMEVLFSREGINSSLDFEDIGDLAYNRFPRGEKWEAINQMRHCCTIMTLHLDGVSEGYDEEYFAIRRKHAWFVFYQWCMYLWEQEENNKDTQYVLGLRSFISKHQELWCNGLTSSELSINVYHTDHDNFVQAFEAEVPYLNMMDKSIILYPWTR